MDQHQKLRLKVCTNTGLNIMCTVNKDWTVDQLYPHITKLYKQVTEDQGGQHLLVHITTLKKNNYFIPKSQIVGQIFLDGDEVNCNVETKPLKNVPKKQRMNEKKNQKETANRQSKSKNKPKQEIPEKKNNQKSQKNEQKPKSKQKQLKNIPKNNNNKKDKQPKQVQNQNSNKSKENEAKNDKNGNQDGQKNQKSDKKKRNKRKQNQNQIKTVVDQQQLMRIIKLNKPINSQQPEKHMQNNESNHKKQQSQNEQQMVNQHQNRE